MEREREKNAKTPRLRNVIKWSKKILDCNFAFQFSNLQHIIRRFMAILVNCYA